MDHTRRSHCASTASTTSCQCREEAQTSEIQKKHSTTVLCKWAARPLSGLWREVRERARIHHELSACSRRWGIMVVVEPVGSDATPKQIKIPLKCTSSVSSRAPSDFALPPSFGIGPTEIAEMRRSRADKAASLLLGLTNRLLPRRGNDESMIGPIQHSTKIFQDSGGPQGLAHCPSHNVRLRRRSGHCHNVVPEFGCLASPDSGRYKAVHGRRRVPGERSRSAAWWLRASPPGQRRAPE